MPRKTLTNALRTGIAFGVLGLPGCELTPEGQSFTRGLISHAIKEEISSEINPRQTNVTIYNQAQQQKRQQQQVYRLKEEYTIPDGVFVYNKWIDLDNDGIMARNELFGLGEKLSFKEKEVCVAFNVPENYEGDVLFRAWTSNGKLIGQSVQKASGRGLLGYVIYPGIEFGQDENPPDFVRGLTHADPGGYRITVNAGGVVYSIDIEIQGENK